MECLPLAHCGVGLAAGPHFGDAGHPLQSSCLDFGSQVFPINGHHCSPPYLTPVPAHAWSSLAVHA